MNELMIFASTIPVGIIVGVSIRIWAKKRLTPTEKAAKMIRVARRNDRAAWNKFIKEFNATKD